MNIFNYIIALSKLEYAIHMANKAHEQDGQCYYVMPDANDRLIILTRYSFRKLKKQGLISSKATITDITRESFYFTPHANGTGALSPVARKAKRKMYLEYTEFRRKQKRAT